MVRKGFSLVEVIVGMLLLSIGMLGIAGSSLMAMQMLREAGARDAVLERAQTVLDSIIVHDIAGAGIVEDPRFQLNWAATGSSVEIHALLADGYRFQMRAVR